MGDTTLSAITELRTALTQTNQSNAQLATAVTGLGKKFDAFVADTGKKKKTIDPKIKARMEEDIQLLIWGQAQLMAAQMQATIPNIGLDGKIAEAPDLMKQFGGPLGTLKQMLEMQKMFLELDEPEGSGQTQQQDPSSDF